MTKKFLADRQDQKLQAVIFAAGIDLRLDGFKQEKTEAAMRPAAERLGIVTPRSAAESLGIVTAISRKTLDSLETALLNKLKDPQFHKDALNRLSKIVPPTEDSVKATKIILEAAGHRINRDPETGLVDGNMNGATMIALANTKNGVVKAEFKANTVAQGSSGLKPEQVAGLFPNAPEVGASFAGAAIGATAVATGPQQQGPQQILVARAPS